MENRRKGYVVGVKTTDTELIITFANEERITWQWKEKMTSPSITYGDKTREARIYYEALNKFGRDEMYEIPETDEELIKHAKTSRMLSSIQVFVGAIMLASSIAANARLCKNDATLPQAAFIPTWGYAGGLVSACALDGVIESTKDIKKLTKKKSDK